MSEIPFRMIDLGPRKRKQELHDDVKCMFEYNGYPRTWEEDGKPIKLAKATEQQLWSRFMDLMPEHWKKKHGHATISNLNTHILSMIRYGC